MNAVDRPRLLVLVLLIVIGVSGCGGSTHAAQTTPAASKTTSSTRSNPSTTATRGPVPAAASACTGCMTVEQLRTAYGVAPLIARGIDGRGETVVLPEEYVADRPPGVTDIRADLHAFDTRLHLPAATLGSFGAGSRAQAWVALPEEALDAEMVHAIAPGARIRILRVAGRLARELPETLRSAATLGDVVSISYGVGETCLGAAAARAAAGATATVAAHGVTVVVSGGDDGAVARACGGPPSTVRGVGFPASDPSALAVGGTSLHILHSGAWDGETAWNDNAEEEGHGAGVLDATGGGFSRIFPRPAYQRGVPGIGSHRGVPDVSADADGETGLERVVVVGGRDVAVHTMGTSAAAPLWAGIAALADQEAHRPLGELNPAVYRIARSARYHRAFHDITSGDNSVTLPSGTRITGASAHRGWDPLTGWGSPDAAVLVPLLARSGG